MPVRLPLVLILVLAFSFGLVNVLATGRLSAPQPWKVIEQLTIVSLVFWWYRIDKSLRKYQSGMLLNMSVVALSIVAIPIYLFRSRGAKQGLKSFLLFVVFVGAMLSALVLGGFVAENIAP